MLLITDETESTMTRCFQKDWEKCVYKLKRFIKDPDDLEGVKDILEEHYTELCNMFKLCCCFEIGEEPFDIQINGVMEFNNTLLQIPNVELDTIFIATNFTSKKEKNNPERALVRHNWLEFISRMAIAKYAKPLRPGEEKLEPPLALDKLMETNLLPDAPTIDSLHLRHTFFGTIHLTN